jgi:hypothetical protein
LVEFLIVLAVAGLAIFLIMRFRIGAVVVRPSDGALRAATAMASNSVFKGGTSAMVQLSAEGTQATHSSARNDDVEALLALVDRMITVSPMSASRAEMVRRDYIVRLSKDPAAFSRMRAEDPLTHLALPDGEREAAMKAMNNDLGAQVKIVRDSFDHWLTTGTPAAPYYAHRIAVILRKAERQDLERQFLEAWLRHFPTGNGARYEELAARPQALHHHSR